MPLLPRPELNNLPAVTHGGPYYSADLQNLGLSADRILDFSICCNPYPPPAAVRKSLQRLKINLYPDSQSLELRLKLSQKLGVPIENLLAGNGSTELIRLIASAYFNKGDQVLIPCPTYGEYALAAHIAGAEVINYQMEWQKTESETIQGLVAAVRKYRPKAVFLCNPNNPTGQYFGQTDMENLISNLGDSLLILDEAYINFVDEPWSSHTLIDMANLIAIRSMTKDYGLAGLRLGYAIAKADIINTLRGVCPPWNVNSAAQQGGIFALDAEDFLKVSQKRIQKGKLYLIRELNKIGFTTLPSKTNFFLLKVVNAKAFRQTLMNQGILVRDCASFGLPEYVRLAPRTLTDCRKLIGTLKRFQQKGEMNGGI